MRTLLTAIVLSGTSLAQTLVVSNRGDETVQLFDPKTRTSIGVFDVGVGAHEFAVSPDGRTVVGACYGSGPMHRKADNRLVVLSLEEPGTPKMVDLGDNPRPNGLAFIGPDRLVVTSEVKQRLLVLDTKTWEIEEAVPFDVPGGHMVSVSPDGKRAFVPSVPTGKVALVDLGAKPTDLRLQVMVAPGAEGLALSPAGDALWVACHQASIIGVVDPATLRVVDRIEADGMPFRVRFTPNGERVVVAHPMAGEVRIYSSADRTLEGSVAIEGGAPTCLAVSDDSRYAFAVCGPRREVAMIDVESAELIHRFETGEEPDAIAFTPFAAGAK